MLQEQVTPTVQGPSQAVQGFGPGCCCAFAPWFNLEPFYAYDGYTAPPKEGKNLSGGIWKSFSPFLFWKAFAALSAVWVCGNGVFLLGACS